MTLIGTFLLVLLTQSLHSFSSSLNIGNRSWHHVTLLRQQCPDMGGCMSGPHSQTFSHVQAQLVGKFNAMVAFGCRYFKILNFEGLKIFFLNFMSFQI
uniref:Secreted protein n=1 Tax=Rhipicephalus zambeziensis TaxID=60191 RepID=A0A224Y6I4_9ACAR